MNPILLFRKEATFKKEIEAAKKYFNVVHYRTEVPQGSLVIGRYSCLPFYHELQYDITKLGSELINDYFQHDYIASMDYVFDIQADTFPTWFRLQDVPINLRDKPLVLKGRTNSRKFEWKTKMFASNFTEATEISGRLLEDQEISRQGLAVRLYEPLETFEIGINDMPMTNEWRLFFLNGELISYGYYWDILDDKSKVDLATPDFIHKGIPFATEVATKIIEQIPFVAIDIAKSRAGKWIVVECNDGQQSGLNGQDPEKFYSNLYQVLSKQLKQQKFNNKF